jgi:hypothetical protein
MPKKKKRDIDLTTEEVAKKLFPKKVRDELKRIAHEKEAKKDKQ